MASSIQKIPASIHKTLEKSLSVFDSLFGALFVVDKKGLIYWTGEKCKDTIGFDSRELTGRNIFRFCREQDALKNAMASMKKGGEKQLYVFFRLKEKRPDRYQESTVRMKMVEISGKNFFLISLIRSVAASWFNSTITSLSRSLNSGFLFLDKQSRVLTINQRFLEFARFEAETGEALIGKEFDSLLEKNSLRKYRDKNRALADYLKESLKNVKSDWHAVYKPQFKSMNNFLKEWLPNTDTKIALKKGRLIVSQDKRIKSDCYLIFREPVNIFDTDLMIRFRGYSPKPSDLSCMLGSNVPCRGHFPDEEGYFFGFGAFYNSVNMIQKKGIKLVENAEPLPEPNRHYLVEIIKNGCRFSMNVNGEEILYFTDPCPLIGPGHAHFSLYTTAEQSVFYDVQIYQRKSRLDMDRLNDLNSQEIIFKSNPYRVFSLRREPGVYVGKPAQLLLLDETSAEHELANLDSALGREPETERLERVRKYIGENVARQINFQELAKMVSFSYSKFSKIFKDQFGVSPMEYHLSLKINRAKNLIKSGKYLIKEVAFLLGYTTDISFINIFKKKTGLSPAEFQKSNAN
jgi:AraC-like DNA-binding protein